MKKLTLILISLFVCILLFACGSGNTDPASSSENDMTQEENTSSVLSDGTDTSSGASSSGQSDETSLPFDISGMISDTPSLSEEYTFLNSPDRIVASCESFSIVYEYTFYLVKEKTEGALLVTTLIDSSAAEEYYLSVKNEYDSAILSGCSVITVMTGKALPFYGYSEEKLLSSLDSRIYTVTVFHDETSGESK